ncbi:MAG: hypothetical protein V1770_04935 [bacterium]
MFKLTILFIAATVLITPVTNVKAAGLLPDCDISGAATDQKGSRACTLDDILVLAVKLINYMLAIAGSLGLLFFVYGGFTWLISAGNSDKVSKGKEILSSAALGILVVLASWMIVNFVYTTLLGTGQEGGAKKEWWTNK